MSSTLLGYDATKALGRQELKAAIDSDKTYPNIVLENPFPLPYGLGTGIGDATTHIRYNTNNC